MAPTTDSDKAYQLEYEAFQNFLTNQPLGLKTVALLGCKVVPELIEGVLRYLPGIVGFKLRYYYYKMLLDELGKNVLIDMGVVISGPRNLKIGEFTWIDTYCLINSLLGRIEIGKRVHVAPLCIIGAREPIVIEDFVGLSAGVKIYSNSEAPIAGKRMSGPMVPEYMKAFKAAPVILRKDSFVGANSVILPGVELGEGAVVGANSVVVKSVDPWTIVAGVPARPISKREPGGFPEI